MYSEIKKIILVASYFKRTDRDEYLHVLQLADRPVPPLSDDTAMLMVNQSLAIVGHDDKFVSAKLVNK